MLTRSRLSYTLCMLLGAVSLAQTGKPAPAAAFAGTWFGSFNVSTPDGKPRRDNAVMVFADNGGTLTGGAGSGIDKLMPISGVQLTGDEIRFHMEAGGGLDFKLKRQGDHLWEPQPEDAGNHRRKPGAGSASPRQVDGRDQRRGPQPVCSLRRLQR